MEESSRWPAAGEWRGAVRAKKITGSTELFYQSLKIPRKRVILKTRREKQQNERTSMENYPCDPFIIEKKKTVKCPRHTRLSTRDTSKRDVPEIRSFTSLGKSKRRTMNGQVRRFFERKVSTVKTIDPFM